MELNIKTKLILALMLVVFGVFMRVIPHAWNFTPIVAIALFAGVYLGRTYIVPIIVATMLMSDIFLGFYSTPVMISVYGSFMLIGGLGLLLNRYKNFTTVVGTSIVSSTLFYLITNFAVWKFGALYPQTFDGLILSYTMALPFFRNMFVGDLVFVAILFGAYEFATLYARQIAQNRAKV